MKLLLRLACACLLPLAVPAQSPLLPPSILDLPLRPAALNTRPGPEYSDEQRDYAMVIGMDRTPKGRIWAAWVAGGDSPKAYFVAASSDDGGRTWSKPRLVIDAPDAPTGLEVSVLVGNFWTDPTGRLWLFYDQSLHMFDGRAGLWAVTCDNPDAEEPVWSAPRRIWHGMTLNKPTVLGNGDWLLPISLWTRDRIGVPELREHGHRDLDEVRMANLFVSTDQGRTWSRRGGVRVPQTDFDEHMVVELKDGRLWLLARTTYGLAESFSSDQGRTWSAAQPSKIQNVSSRFFIRRLTSGSLLLVKNGPIDQRLKSRSHLTAFLSEDEGRTWTGGLVLDEREGVSYPDGFQAPDGVIHIVHDRERAKEREILMHRFTEADVRAGRIVSPGAALKMLVNKARGPRLGDRLYNGIQLPGEWPPRNVDPQSAEPMPLPWLERPPAVIPIQRGRQLFVDDFLIESTTLKRVHHLAKKHPANPVFKPETPAELQSTGLDGDQQAVCYLGHGGVFYNPAQSRFEMFYTAGWRGGLALATSRDLLHWTRPGNLPAGGNLILPPGRDFAGEDNAVWLDLSARDPKQRYKALIQRGAGHTLHTSPNGLVWSNGTPAGKSGDYSSFFHNPFRNVWVQSIKRDGPRGRARHYFEHADFLKSAERDRSVPWTHADRLDPPDPGIGDAAQLYSLNAVAYESLMLGEFYLHLGPDNRICDRGKFPKTTEIQLGFSRDGFHWHRPDRRPFIAATRREGDWDRAYLHGTMGVCAVVGDELWFPYTGYSGIAPNGSRGLYTGASIGMAVLRRDGFASMAAGDETGVLTTRPVAFNGRHLFVNAVARGELRVEVLDAEGRVIPPFSAAECEPVSGDGTRLAVRWKHAPTLDAVRGQPVKFRFHLRQGHLYAFWVSPDAGGASQGHLGAGGPGFRGVTDTPAPAQP